MSNQAQFAEDHWNEIAARAVAAGQSENDFLLSCHIANRPAALQAYRRAGTGVSTPSVARSSVDQIKAALRARNYSLFADSQVGPKGEQISWWTDGEHICILHEYRQGCGCELYVQATTKNSVEATIEAIPVTDRTREELTLKALNPAVQP